MLRDHIECVNVGPVYDDEGYDITDSTAEDRASYRQMLAEWEPDDWHDLDTDQDNDGGPEIAVTSLDLCDALAAIAEHYEGLETEVAVLVARSLREKASEGICLGRPKDLSTWDDRAAVEMGWHR